MKTIEKDPTIQKFEAELKARRFQEQLISLIKRINPEEYARRISTIIFHIIDDKNQWAKNPIHNLLNSIEVNCAYSGYFSNQELSEEKYNRIRSHYNNYDDPYLLYLIREKKSVYLLLLAMAKQQFWSQKWPNYIEFARTLNIFYIDNPLPTTSRLFEQQTTIKILDWIYLNFLVFTNVITNHSPVITESYFVDSDIKSLSKKAVKPFFAISSLSIAGIRKRYMELHQDVNPIENIFIPSVFSERPFICIKENTYILPHPNLPIIHTTDGLYMECLRVGQDNFLSEFSKSFEKYIGKVISEIPGIINVYREKEIQEISNGRTSDYLIELNDCIVLIECKSIRYSSFRYTENAIEKDNSTGKIADAYSQLIETAKRIDNNELDGLLSESKKPLFGFCITFGEMYFINSPSFYYDFIQKRMKIRDYDYNLWPSPFKIVPQTISINDLEKIVVTLKDQQFTLKEFVELKNSIPFEKAGDWNSYLQNREYIGPSKERLRIAEKAFTWFTEFMEEGIAKELET